MNLKTFEDLKKSLDAVRLAEFMEFRDRVEKKLVKSKYLKEMMKVLDKVQKEYENPK